MIRERRFVALPLAVALVILAQPRTAASGGLSCSMGEVVVENLKIGHRYSLKALANLPLTLTNTGDRVLRVGIEPLVPGPSELRHGAEPIPDLRWASAAPETLEIGPHEARAAELTINLPEDPTLLGRRFQVNFWSHGLPEPGEMLAVGLKSRVIFSIDRELDPRVEMPSGDLSLALSPAELRLERLVPGRIYRLESFGPRPLTVRNTSSRPVQVELQATSAEAMGGGSENGYADLMGFATVGLAENRFTLAPGEERAIRGTIALSQARSIKGKSLMCVIAAMVTDQPVRTQICTRIYARSR